MKKYYFSFTGRQTGAIGIIYPISENYEANSLGEALFKLWTDYELIRFNKAEENGKSIETENLWRTKLIEVDYKKKPDRK